MVKPAPAALANLCPTPELLAATWQASSQRLLWFDGDGALLAASDAFLHSYGEQGRLQPGMALEQLITITAPATLSQLRNPLALSNPQPSASLQLANGERRAVAIRPLLLADGSTLALLVDDLDHAGEDEAIRRLQHDVLEGLATGTGLTALLELLCRRVEALAPEVICSVLRIENGLLRPVAAPSVPAVFSAAIDGVAIGPVAGSCGTAAWRGGDGD